MTGFLIYEGGEVAEELRENLTRVRIGALVTEIRNGAFRGCKKLTEVQFNEGTKTIDEEAFQDCIALRSITTPSTVTELGKRAFFGCHKLAEVKLNEGLQVIGECAFQGCTSLQSVSVPSTVTKLGGYALCDCSNLADVQLNEGLQIIEAGAFWHSKALRSLTLPSTVVELGKFVFWDCRNLVEVQLNEGLQIIGERTFASCRALLSATIPSTVTELGDWAFRYCSDLAEVKLNEGLRVIGAGAFRDCTALQSVTIPSTVTKLGYQAFSGCSDLSEVIFLGGERLLDHEFLNQCLLCEEGMINIERLHVMIAGYPYPFHECRKLSAVKLSVSRALCERMVRLLPESRLSVLERIRNLPRLELMQDGAILACFPVVSIPVNVQDTNLETARSLHRILQSIAYHELKEASIVIELAIWKSRIDVDRRERTDCRVSIPDPAKILIMEYFGLSGFESDL